ncbi:MAG: sulfatase family protein [Planctomycetota bacterium]|jgi:choline-sulfatase
MKGKTSQPNILFLMDDQHRFDYLGAAGASFLATPNLDRLAGQGVHFTHCMTNSPVCAPARIGLATGNQPARLGALDNASYLPNGARTYMQRLRDHGYRVGGIGKIDLAKPDPYNGRYGDRPCVYGWGFTHPEECEGKMHAGNHPEPIGPYTHYLQERGLLQAFHEDYRSRSEKGWIKGVSHDSVLPAEAFEDIYIGRRAVQWIETIPSDFPWHLFVSFVGPHDPFDPPKEYAERYRRAEVPGPIPPAVGRKPVLHERLSVPMEPEEIAVTRRQYCGLITLIDDQVGRILEALERRGMRENTIIVFTSDHGEMLGDHGLYTKCVAFEPSLRVPLIIAGPKIAGGRRSDALVELIDVNPTICELAGLPPQENIDALSLAPLLRGETAEHRTETISAFRNFRCIRTARYKLVQNYNDMMELYDLEKDPHETVNLAEGEPEIVLRLARRMRERFMEGKWLR